MSKCSNNAGQVEEAVLDETTQKKKKEIEENP